MFDRPIHHRLIEARAQWYRLQRFCSRRGVAARRASRCRDEFYRAIWHEAAAALGASIQPNGDGAYRIRRGNHTARVCRNWTPLDSPDTLALAGDKPRVHRLLQNHGIATPPHEQFTLRTLDRAVEFLHAADTPCVVKPARDTGAGHGVTTGIHDTASLSRAAALAASYGRALLIEQQIPGMNYRLLYLDGVLLDAVLRKPPTVVGDGRSTIRTLVHNANAIRSARNGAARGQFLLTVDLDMHRTLAAQALDLDAVPGAGRVVTLKTVVNENARDDNEPAVDRLAYEIVATGARAAALAGARLAGVDIITVDPTVPLDQSGGVVCEINTTPGLYYHYRKTGGATRVAIPILEALLSDGASEPAAAPRSAPSSTRELAPR